jgi:hypothetical protein
VLQPGVIPDLVDKLHITPNGAMFAPPSVVPGVLPRMLSEARRNADVQLALAEAGVRSLFSADFGHSSDG